VNREQAIRDQLRDVLPGTVARSRRSADLLAAVLA